MLITRIRQGYFSLANKFGFHGKGGGVKVFIAISVAVFAFSALFLKVERCQKDSGGDYSHLWFVSGSVLNVDSSGDFTMSVESEDPYNDGSDRLTILVDSEHTRYVSDSPVSVGSKVKVGYFLDSRKRNTIRCSSVDVLELILSNYQ